VAQVLPQDHIIAPRTNLLEEGGGGAQKGSADRDSDYIPEQKEVW
jgi:hypothetical protein